MPDALADSFLQPVPDGELRQNLLCVALQVDADLGVGADDRQRRLLGAQDEAGPLGTESKRTTKVVAVCRRDRARCRRIRKPDLARREFRLTGLAKAGQKSCEHPVRDLWP